MGVFAATNVGRQPRPSARTHWNGRGGYGLCVRDRVDLDVCWYDVARSETVIAAMGALAGGLIPQPSGLLLVHSGRHLGV